MAPLSHSGSCYCEGELPNYTAISIVAMRPAYLPDEAGSC